MIIDDKELLELKHKIQETIYCAKQALDLFNKIIDESEVRKSE